jgi:ribosomal protein S18 acetylase RimI-like enzyme
VHEVEIPVVRPLAGIEIRRGGAGDEAALGSMSDIIFRELAKAPYWHPTPPEVWPDLEEGWSELATDPEVKVWLAEENGRVLGTIAFWDEQETAEAMLVPPKTFTFSVVATREEARGRGIGTALTWTGIGHYRDAGYDYCFTDWISPNLAASRFWPRFGFTEAAYRLTRNINPMIAWTR